MFDFDKWIYSRLMGDTTLQALSPSGTVNIVMGGVDKVEVFPSVCFSEPDDHDPADVTFDPNDLRREIVMMFRTDVLSNAGNSNHSNKLKEQINDRVRYLMRNLNTNTDSGHADNVRVRWSKVISNHDTHDETRSLATKILNIKFYLIGV